VSSLGVCYCFTVPSESNGEEARIASMLLELSRSPEGARGMAMLVTRAPHTPRQVYLFPGSQPHVRQAIDDVLRRFGGSPCEPPAADETMFLVGSTAVWKRLPRSREQPVSEG